jgi:hypothetical protein
MGDLPLDGSAAASVEQDSSNQERAIQRCIPMPADARERLVNRAGLREKRWGYCGCPLEDKQRAPGHLQQSGALKKEVRPVDKEAAAEAGTIKARDRLLKQPQSG